MSEGIVQPLLVREGLCHILYALDIGQSIDLKECDHRITALKQRARVKHKRRAPQKYYEYESPPLRITQEAASIELGSRRTQPNIDLVIHEFGAVTVLFSVAVEGPFAELRDLSDRLYDNAALKDASRRCVEQLLDDIRPAINKPALADVVEDYAIYEIKAWTAAAPPAELCGRYATPIAQVLRSETALLSTQEVDDALSARLSFGPEDLAIVDWNAAILFDSDAEDVRTVLELANAELLEMRFLDEQLDEAMEQAYQALVMQRKRRTWRIVRGASGDLQRIAALQVDSALLFEGTNNAIKLLGDQYLARVYRLASQRFHLTEWDTNIIRKLHTLESIYEKMTDRASNLRMETLEWIIILLIAVSIALPIVFEVAKP